jgi:hypothetical protein
MILDDRGILVDVQWNRRASLAWTTRGRLSPHSYCLPQDPKIALDVQLLFFDDGEVP